MNTPPNKQFCLTGAELHKLMVLAQAVDPNRLVRMRPFLGPFFRRISALGRQLAPIWEPAATCKTEAEAARAWAFMLADLDRCCACPTDTIIINASAKPNIYDAVLAACQDQELPDLPYAAGPNPSEN